MSSCQRLQIQRPMSQAPRDPSTTASTMVATPLSTATQREDLNLNALSLLQGQMSKKNPVWLFQTAAASERCFLIKAITTYLRVRPMN